MRYSTVIRRKSFIVVVFLVTSMLLYYVSHVAWNNYCQPTNDTGFKNLQFARVQDHSTAADVSQLRQRISAVCKNYGLMPRLTFPPPKSFLVNVLVSDRYQTLFCFVPKVACSNWKRIFLVLNGHFNTTGEITRTIAHGSGLLETLDNNSDTEIRHKLKTYKKVTFVREPLERLLSAFRNKIAYDYNGKFHHRFGMEIIKKYRKNLTGEVSEHDRATFPEFVKYLVHLEPTEKRDVHWERQHNLCDPCGMNYDFIGRYESLRYDALQALELMGATNAVSFPDTGKAPEGKETKTLMTDFFSQISQQEFMELEKLYELDYEMFGYRKPIYSEIIATP